MPRKDFYYNKAKVEGYRSRASYKLKQINEVHKIIKRNDSVVHMGAAPGGWLQVAQKISGNQGKVMGIDISFVEEIPNVKIIQDNIENIGVIDEVISYFGKKVGSVICDLSPQVSGNWSVDHAAQISLNYSAVKIMEQVLDKKGNALFKVFDGEYSAEFFDFMKTKFVKTKRTKPKASRKPSSELYCVCMGYL